MNVKGERGQVLEGEEKLSGFFIQQKKEHEPLLVFHRFVFCDTVSLPCPQQLKKWINVKIIPANAWNNEVQHEAPLKPVGKAICTTMSSSPKSHVRYISEQRSLPNPPAASS